MQIANEQNCLFNEINEMGKQLSVKIGCPVRYCAFCYDKPLFECKHGIPFPAYAVRVCMDNGDYWPIVIAEHDKVNG